MSVMKWFQHLTTNVDDFEIGALYKPDVANLAKAWTTTKGVFTAAEPTRKQVSAFHVCCLAPTEKPTGAAWIINGSWYQYDIRLNRYVEDFPAYMFVKKVFIEREVNIGGDNIFLCKDTYVTFNVRIADRYLLSPA